MWRCGDDAEEIEVSIASNYALRLPASLKRELEKVAREDGTSLNQLIVTAVAEKLSALRTADSFEERRARHHAPQTGRGAA